ncbi:MAG: mobile mystery protein B [Candidatus Sabulitectum sp.]|nr:mobile mystery protein B [Candidatus Sabulitectum sp.]
MNQFAYPEGATPLDESEINGLVLTHITTRSQLDRWEFDNILEAVSWLDRTKPKDILNEHFVKTLHRKMFGSVWRWAGQFRKSEKTVDGPWLEIGTGLRKLCDDTQYKIDIKSESSDEIAIRFHHKLVWIHPFPNGNGRHARLLTDTLLANVLDRPPFTWGRGNLTKDGATRSDYITALQLADRGFFDQLRQFVRS